jgi:hypothetical protein
MKKWRFPDEEPTKELFLWGKQNYASIPYW